MASIARSVEDSIKENKADWSKAKLSQAYEDSKIEFNRLRALSNDTDEGRQEVCKAYWKVANYYWRVRDKQSPTPTTKADLDPSGA